MNGDAGGIVGVSQTVTDIERTSTRVSLDIGGKRRVTGHDCSQPLKSAALPIRNQGIRRFVGSVSMALKVGLAVVVVLKDLAGFPAANDAPRGGIDAIPALHFVPAVERHGDTAELDCVLPGNARAQKPIALLSLMGVWIKT